MVEEESALEIWSPQLLSLVHGRGFHVDCPAAGAKTRLSQATESTLLVKPGTTNKTSEMI